MGMKPPPVRGKWIGLGAGVILIGVATAALSVAWRERAAATKPQPHSQASAKIFTATEVSLAGKIQAPTVEQIAAPIEGKVEQFHVEVGDEVYEGQLLAQLGSETLESEQAAAQMELNREQTKVNDLESAIVAARLEASRARAEASRAQSEYERANKVYQRQKFLLGEGATPRLVFQKAEKEYTSAKGAYDNLDEVAKQSEDRVSSIVRELDNAKKQLQHVSEEADTAKEHLAAGNVHSPVNGIVVGRRGEQGGAVDPSIKNLFEIATDLSHLEVVADAAPEILARVKPGQPAVVRVAENPGEGLGGIVARVEQGHVVVGFGNPNPLVKPGLTAQVIIKFT